MLNLVRKKMRQLMIVSLLFIASSASADYTTGLDWAIQVAERYAYIKPNITYLTVANYDAKLDLYIAKGEVPKPTVIYIHGGGWAGGLTKETTPLVFLPFLHLGWNVVNVEYRASNVSLAPAAVEDCLCALRWVGLHADEYNIDVNQVVVMGRSAGGHLALTTGMFPTPESELGYPCINLRNMTRPNSGVTIRPAAIVNWFGITDVIDLIEGKNRRDFAVAWIGNRRDRRELAQSVSPVNHVRGGIPPIVTVHSDRDEVVPYEQAVRLHAALSKANVKNKLITVSGAPHGPLGDKDALAAYSEILKFLSSAGIRVNVVPQSN